MAGSGLLPGNEVGPVTDGGFGGEAFTGILYDDVSRTLSVNIAWGSNFSFGDLSGDAVAGHIHGPANFDQEAGVLIALFGGTAANPFVESSSYVAWTAANGGFVTGTTVFTTAFDASGLFNELWYINIHTEANPGGEIRGNIVAGTLDNPVVPEPSTWAAIAGAAALAAAAWMRRRRA